MELSSMVFFLGGSTFDVSAVRMYARPFGHIDEGNLRCLFGSFDMTLCGG